MLFDSAAESQYWYVSLLFVLAIVSLTGCSSQYGDNPHGDWVFVPDETEKEMGRNAAKKLEDKIGVYNSDTLAQYVDNIGSRVAIYSERPDLQYRFKVLDLFLLNALALPGGHVYVTRGLLNELDSESQLAGILAHEVAHVTAYHAVKRRQWSIVSMLSAVALATQTGGRSVGGSLMAREMFKRGYTRASEDEADRLGMKYAARAGYDPQGLIQFLAELERIHGRVPDRRLLMLRTHPFLVDRIQRTKQLVDEFSNLLSDNPTINRQRYKRYTRNYLFTPLEDEFLTRFDKFLSAYKRQRIKPIKEMLGAKFKFGAEDNADTSTEFLGTISKRFQNSRKIEYSHRLLELDVSDTDATVFFEFQSKRWKHDSSKPILSSGRQEMVWKEEDDVWKLIRLR